MTSKLYETIEIRGRISHQVKSYVAASELLNTYRASYIVACEMLDVDGAAKYDKYISDLAKNQSIAFRQIEKLIDKCAVDLRGSVGLGYIFRKNRTATDHVNRLIALRSNNDPLYYNYLMIFESRGEENGHESN